MYPDCISTLARDQLTTFEGKKWEQLPYLGVVAVPEICQKTCRNFHRKEAGTAAYLGVVAVPRDMPEGTFVTGLVWGTFGSQSTDMR